MLKRICTETGDRDGWTPRELRTSFVSLMSHQGVSIEEIARLAARQHPHHRDRLPPRTTPRHHHRRPDHGPALHRKLASPDRKPLRIPPASGRSLITPAGRGLSPADRAMATQPIRLAATRGDHPPVTTRPDRGDQGQDPGAQCSHARWLSSYPASPRPRALAAAGATVPGALAASGRGGCHPQRGMVGIGHRDLVAPACAGSPPCRAATHAGGCSRHDRARACRCRGHRRQAPAAAPESPAADRLAPAAAAGLSRPGTSPARPHTVTAGSRTCQRRRPALGDYIRQNLRQSAMASSGSIQCSSMYERSAPIRH
jgi:hypothetical protein